MNSARSRPARSLAPRIAVSLVSLALSLWLAEKVVRARYADSMVLFPRYHTDARYGDFTLRRIRPGSTFHHTSPDGRWEFRTNAQGFRNDRNFGYEKPPGTVRILCIGDSNTQGYEVGQEETYCSVIQAELAGRGYSAEVLNAGVSGFSTAEALAFLDQEGIRYQPDAVVLGFFANDPEDNIKAGLYGLEGNGSLRLLNRTYLPGVAIQNAIYAVPGVKWLSENSYLYSWGFNSVWDYYKRLRFKEQAEEITEYALPTQQSFSDYQLDLTAALIRRIYDLCRERGIRFYLLDIPAYRENAPPTSSLTPELLARLHGLEDRTVLPLPLLARHYGSVDLHRPHGHHHITEFSHAKLGEDVARRILNELDPAP